MPVAFSGRRFTFSRFSSLLYHRKPGSRGRSTSSTASFPSFRLCRFHQPFLRSRSRLQTRSTPRTTWEILGPAPNISHVVLSGGSRGGSRGAMEPRVLRNYEGFVVALCVIGALAIVYVTLSLSALAFTAPITRA